VKRGQTLIQRREMRTRVGGIRVERQNTLGLQFGGQLLFDVAPVGVRIGGIFGTFVFLHPLDGIEGTGAMRARRARISLRCGGSACAGGACAPARAALTVKKRETLSIRTAATKNDLFIVTPQWKISRQCWGTWPYAQ